MVNKKELLELLEQPHVLLDMSYDEILKRLGLVVARMYNYEQKNPHHCFDLLRHSIYSIIHISNMDIEINTKRLLLVAALYHDVGKVDTMFMKNGVMHFYGHARVSRKLAYPILKDMGFEDDEVLEICFYIEHHDDFISFKNDNIDRKGIHKVVHRVIKYEKEQYNHDIGVKHFVSLMYLCEADALSQSDYVYKDDILVDSKDMKIERTNIIKNIIKELS